ncbi:MAG TPA: CHASE3 domain-containing protein, partial [Kofleriaceae bacterium]|nr:CHASE3 domain-containing protein [Kofleriaceae bacterium]
MTRLLSIAAVERRVSPATLGLVLALAILAAIAAIAYRHLASLDDMELQVSHTHDVLETTQAMVIAMGDAGRARRAYAITRDDTELATYHAAVARATAARLELRILTMDNPDQQARLDKIDEVIAARLAELGAAVRDAQVRPLSAERDAVLTDASLPLNARLGALVRQVEAEEHRLLDARNTAMHDQSTSVRRALLVGIGAAIVILVGAFLFSRREVQRRRRSEAQLAERERHLAATLSSIGDDVIATDAAGAITRMN